MARHEIRDNHSADGSSEAPPMHFSVERTPDQAELLQGVQLHGGASLDATRVLIRHLEMLGATHETQESDGTSGRTADRLRIGSADSGQPAVNCTISWAEPAAADLVDEVTVQAGCGLMAVHGRAEGGPQRIAVNYASVVSGVVAAQGVLAGLYAGRTGAGVRQVETSVAQAALLTVSQYLAAATVDGEPADELSVDNGRGCRPPFVSSDGVRFELEALDVEPWRRFWHTMQAPVDTISRGWRPFLLRYANAVAPVPRELHEAVRRRSYDSIALAAAEAGLSICPVRSRRDRQAEPGTRGQAPPWSVRPHPGPRTSARSPVPAPDAALPLAGVCVVEATRRVQGPLAAHLLGLLGARVIRVEPPGGDPLRGMPPMLGDCSARFLALNRGKETVEIDIKDPADRERLLQLGAHADVFLHNWAPGRAEQLGLGSADFAAVNPGIVYAYASAWGSELGAGAPLGTDFVVQAYSGLAEQLFADDSPPRPSLMTLLDVLGGLICAEGILVGLLARQRDGIGQSVGTSLLGAATMLQSMGGRPAGAPAWQPWDRPLRTRDGAVVVRVTDDSDLNGLLGVLGIGSGERDPATHVLDRAAGRDAGELCAALRRSGLVAAVVTTDVAQLAIDPRFSAVLLQDGACFVDAPWRFLP